MTMSAAILIWLVGQCGFSESDWLYLLASLQYYGVMASISEKKRQYWRSLQRQRRGLLGVESLAAGGAGSVAGALAAGQYCRGLWLASAIQPALAVRNWRGGWLAAGGFTTGLASHVALG